MTGVFHSCGWGWRGAMTDVMMSPVSGSRQVPAKPLEPGAALLVYTSPLYTVELLYSLCTDGGGGDAPSCSAAPADAPGQSQR